MHTRNDMRDAVKVVGGAIQQLERGTSGKLVREVIEVILIQMQDLKTGKLCNGGGETAGEARGAQDEPLEGDELSGVAAFPGGPGAVNGRVTHGQWRVYPCLPEGLQTANAGVCKCWGIGDEDGLGGGV